MWLDPNDLIKTFRNGNDPRKHLIVQILNGEFLKTQPIQRNDYYLALYKKNNINTSSMSFYAERHLEEDINKIESTI